MDDLPETLLGILLIATITINVAHHIVGHIHFLVKFALNEFLRERSGKFIGFEDALLVQQEHDFVAALGVVGMQIVFVVQIILQFLDVTKESDAVTIVKRMVHRITQRQVFWRVFIVVSCIYVGDAQERYNNSKE